MVTVRNTNQQMWHDLRGSSWRKSSPQKRNISLTSVRRACDGIHMRIRPSARFPWPLTSHKCTQERPARLIHDKPCWKHVHAPPLFYIGDRARCGSPLTASTSRTIPEEQSPAWWLPGVLAWWMGPIHDRIHSSTVFQLKMLSVFLPSSQM